MASLHHRIKNARRALGKHTIRWMGPPLIGGLARSWTPITIGEENLAAAAGDGGGHFMALWHGRMLVPMAHHKGCNWQVLVSHSKDGDVSEGMLESFGYQVIRGSSSKGGARALREMLTALRGGDVLVITPDGPRGPMHSMNAGLAWMARATGYAVVPCGYVADRCWRMKSWDRFTIPKLGARLAFVYGEPVRVERRATPEELEQAGLLIRDRMLQAERDGFAALGMEPEL